MKQCKQNGDAGEDELKSLPKVDVARIAVKSVEGFDKHEDSECVKSTPCLTRQVSNDLQVMQI